MTYEEFCKIMNDFDSIIRRCSKCNHNFTCPMHKISKYVKEIGKTEFLAKLKECGIEEIQKELGIGYVDFL